MTRIGKLVAVSFVSSLLVGAFGAWGGYQLADKRAAERAATVAAQHAAALAEANARYRAKEREHEQTVQDLRADFAAREAEARERDDAVIADLRDGTQRLRLQVTSCRNARLPDADPASGGVDGGDRAELAPETSAALWGIAADGDAAARRLKALQDWAEAAVQLCNGE